jgi:1-acyl-sn-glycerol-3-phosphate acyltransferase
MDSVAGKEHALVISNHRSDIDWLVGWIIAQVVFLPAFPRLRIFYLFGFVLEVQVCGRCSVFELTRGCV